MNFETFDELFCCLLEDLYTNGSDVYGTRELTNIQFTLTNPHECVLNNNLRSASIKYLLAENLWYASGHNEVDFIGKYASLWNNITDDGITNNSAYGYIMKTKHGFNQIEKVIEMLSKNPENRRAVININDANENVIETKDEQCTMFIQFLVRNNKLNMTVCMRSNDLIYGLINDIPAFSGLLIYVASRLNLEVGEYTHFDTSLHYYHNKDKIVDKMMNEYNSNGLIRKDQPYIDWVKLYTNAESIYQRVNADKENIIEICKDCGIYRD